MNSLILISIIWLVAISQCVAISHVALGIPPAAPAGAMVVFQWPMALCKINTCKEGIDIPDSFTLHGVWPTAQDGTTIKTCPKRKFCDSAIAGLQNIDLWKSYLKDKTDRGFQEHEWKKHGSCFIEMDCTHYFISSLRLCQNKSSSILKALKDNSIKPSPDYNVEHKIEKFYDAIVNNLNLRPIIVRKSDRNRWQIKYVVEIMLCIEPSPYDVEHKIEKFYDAIVNNLNLKPIIFCKSKNGKKYVVEIVLCATNDLNDFRNCTDSPERHMKQCGDKDSKALFYGNNPSGGLDIKQRSSQIITTATT